MAACGWLQAQAAQLQELSYPIFGIYTIFDFTLSPTFVNTWKPRIVGKFATFCILYKYPSVSSIRSIQA